MLFQTVGRAVSAGGPRCFTFNLTALALQFSFHSNPKVTFRKGGSGTFFILNFQMKLDQTSLH